MPTWDSGRYALEHQLGAGAFGKVYAATDRVSGARVAIKFFERAENAVTAALQVSRVNHPHVVPVLAAGEHEGAQYLVMPLVEGRTLATCLEHGALAPREAVELLAGVAQALDAIHRAGIAHCDIKPSNIMITDEKPAKAVLIDFNSKAPIDADASLRFLGTPAYAAPEHLCFGRVSPLTDVYAFAAVLAECLTANRTFSRPTHDETVRAHLEGAKPLAGFDHPAALALSPLLDKALSVDPHRRQGTASELIATARAALDKLPLEAIDRPLASGQAQVPPPTTERDE